MKNSRRYDICKYDVRRASYAKHLRSTKLQEKLKIIPSNIFNETNKSKPKILLILKLWNE